MQATIYKSTGSWYIAKDSEGTSYNARLKGALKQEGITSTNPIAVGDVVEMELEAEGAGIIHTILDRHNYIARSSPHNRNQHHIVASNLDQALVFATLRDPRTSSGFIDRFLVGAEAYHIPAVIVFNKADIYRKKEMARFAELQEIYTTVGYTVQLVSLEKREGLDIMQQLLENKTTLVSGHSGVGKSTFINAILPDVVLRTSEVSNWSGKGMHTTTFAEMFDLPFGGRIIDTPGVREFGLTDMSRQELSHYFPEMRSRLNNCQFNNCLHLNEPGCAIKAAVNSGEISEERFVNYLSIMETMEERKW
jgi:ribosome biogenesis GTPase